MPRSKNKTRREAVIFGQIIRRIRIDRHWTIINLADASGMNAAYLGQLESGRNAPSFFSMIALARALGIRASEILRELEERSQQN